MTDTTNPERGAEQTSEGLPIPKLAEPSPVGSPSAVDTDAIVKQVAEQIKRELRMAQSTKDKEIATIKKSLGISDLSELEAMGAQIPDNVKLEYRLRQIETGQPPANSPAQSTSSPGNGAALTAQDVSEAVNGFNLNANDADVIEALRGTYRNRDHFENTLARLAMGKLNKQPPSAAESATIIGSAATGRINVDALNSELQQLVKTPSKPGSMKRITEIKKQLNDAGG
jgi:hypothetical protein